jgi:hypothetical protein
MMGLKWEYRSDIMGISWDFDYTILVPNRLSRKCPKKGSSNHLAGIVSPVQFGQLGFIDDTVSRVYWFCTSVLVIYSTFHSHQMLTFR